MSINRFSLAMSASENERYLVRKGVDMTALLRALVARRNPALLYFGETDDRVETEFLGVNPHYEELVFSPGSDPAALERLLTAGSFGVETTFDSIRMMFIATHAEDTQFKGMRALRARIPDQLARMQRREAVRVATSKEKLSYCLVKISADRESRLRVDDISVGGLGLIVESPEAGIGAGKTFHECSLELPGIGLLRCTLQIVYMNELPADPTQRRVGTRFVDLPGLSREQVRSYVARLERAHLASL